MLLVECFFLRGGDGNARVQNLWLNFLESSEARRLQLSKSRCYDPMKNKLQEIPLPHTQQSEILHLVSINFLQIFRFLRKIFPEKHQ